MNVVGWGAPSVAGILRRGLASVEDIPEPVLTKGQPWNWQSFPDYLDRLDARRLSAVLFVVAPMAQATVHASEIAALEAEGG